jgi:protein involved in sex pheromone biosynthesis
MKTRLILAASASTLLLSACGHMQHKEGYTAIQSNDGYDRVYMARVERAAEATGTKIIWVNPPQIKKSKTHDD